MRVSLRTAAAAALAVTAVILGAGLAHSAQAATVALPPVNGQFDYQIGGSYTPSSSVSIVDRDRSASPVAGKYNICYVCQSVSAGFRKNRVVLAGTV